MDPNIVTMICRTISKTKFDVEKQIMSYATQDILEGLKSTREAKGLSQRNLSALTGVPQSHISKIENAGTDIRLSSLIELARALDLELRLIPRKALPAVDAIVGSAATNASADGRERPPRPAYRLDEDAEDGHG